MPELRYKVLVADNDAHVSDVLCIFLRRAGLDVEQVADGGAARARLTQGDIAALVCDLDMPVLSGEALLEALGDFLPPGSAPAVFVVSGYVDRGAEARLRRQSCVKEVLRKPFDLAAFAARVAAQVNFVDRGSCE